jgi:hypothetical protein
MAARDDLERLFGIDLTFETSVNLDLARSSILDALIRREQNG